MKGSCELALALLLPAPLAFGQGRSAIEELKSFHLADDRLMVELVAAEPDVSSPVSVTWDSAGHMFVAEMIDYPLGPVAGQIRMLEDKDRDGRYESSMVFAENLPFPN